MVAAARALASTEPDPLITDPYAAPLVHEVGIDFFTRLVDGAAPPDETAATGIKVMVDMMAVRTRFFDDFFRDAAAAGSGRPSSWPRPGRPRLPVGPPPAPSSSWTNPR